MVGATLVSAAAFVSLRVLASEGSPALLIAVGLLWTATSSVLRALPLNLIGHPALRPTNFEAPRYSATAYALVLRAHLVFIG